MFEHIDYDPSSSTFFRYNRDVGRKVKKDEEAGSIRNRPFDHRVEITVKRRAYAGSRVAWHYLYGEAPPKDKVVVPIDGDLRNLSKDNLRLMTWAQQRIYVSMTKGVEGCAIRPNKNGTFRSYFIVREGKFRSCEALGTYDTREEAVEVYRRKQMAVFFEENLK